MNNIQIEKKDCCGCKVCAAVCPVNCITLKLDSEQFYYPKIDNIVCIDCGKCRKVCPISNKQTNSKMAQEVYAAWSKDKIIRQDASSGGIFENLARTCLENHGVVFGAAFDDNLQLKHRYATSIEELKPLCKSKYIQSDMNGCYKSVKDFLEKGKEVIFVGTPCQVSAIRNFLDKCYDNLYLIDLVCHGVPSQDLFNKCINYEGKRRSVKIEKYSFRTKINKGATPHYYTEGYIKGGIYKERIGIYHQSPYYFGFQKRITLRPSCYECRFSNPNRVSDITIADFHNIEKYIKKVDRMQGVSMVIVNTIKGKNLFDNVKKLLETFPFDLKTAIQNNECLEKATQMPDERQKFFDDMRTKDFDFVINNHLNSKKSYALSLYYSLPSQIRTVTKKIILKE